MDPTPPRRIRIFCDSDVLIAGAASTSGASHILLRLSELTVIRCLTSPYTLNEAERNLAAKLPAAVPAFRLIVEAALEVLPAPPQSVVQDFLGQAHPKDAPILAAAIVGEADYLATFNVRHFQQRKASPFIQTPGAILRQIRSSLVALLN